MRVTFVGHASLLIETRGLRILSDPWWKGPCFGGQWWLYPEPISDLVSAAPIDYIYISHGHHDHFHPVTLRTLPRTSRVLVSKQPELSRAISELGFPVVELSGDEQLALGNGVSCRILPTHSDDTMMIITDGVETCLDINDALHATSTPMRRHFTRVLRGLVPSLDYVFCAYGIASHFPNCYRVPGKDPVETAIQRQRHFNRAWSEIINALSPRLAFPFAADVVFLEDDLFWSNEPIHNAERPTDVFTTRYPASSTAVVDIAPGFTVEGGRILRNSVRAPVSNVRLKHVYGEALQRVNEYRPVAPERIQALVTLLTDNIGTCHEYLAAFPNDYQCLIRFRGAAEAICVVKNGSSIVVNRTPEPVPFKGAYDLIYTTRASYLTQSLTTEYGHETLFVGSGGLFEYTRASRPTAPIHRELMLIMTRTTVCPTRPAAGLRRRLALAKTCAKRLIGRADEDLYDLERWMAVAR